MIREAPDRVGEVWRQRATGRHALVVARSESDFVGGAWEARWLEDLGSVVQLLELSLIASAVDVVLVGRVYYEHAWERAL